MNKIVKSMIAMGFALGMANSAFSAEALKLGAPAYIAPAAYNGALYVLTDNGQLICIR